MQSDKIFTLSAVTASIKSTLAQRYGSPFWVKAEMNKLNYYSHSGHCYPELVEKQNGRVIAQIKSTFWQADYQRVNSKFLEVLKEPIKDGIKILFQARLTFDSVHGLSLHIIDIDPSYTLGDLEQEKKETIDRLKKEQVFDQNKQLSMPILPQRLAIISVETSKGYADFLDVLHTNSSGYRFFHMLFPALLQGEKAVDSITYQLNVVRKLIRHFDVVCIIRGGGGDVGLSCYNHYSLAKTIATFPIPVLTGIGHATNETVSEMVSHRNGITPTRIAEDLIRQFHLFAQPVESARIFIAKTAKDMLAEASSELRTEGRLFKTSTENLVSKNAQLLRTEKGNISTHVQYHLMRSKQQVELFSVDAQKASRTFLKSCQQEVQYFIHILRKDANKAIEGNQQQLLRLESEVNLLSPLQVLKRGYSITMFNGKALRNVDLLSEGDVVQTILADGEMTSKVSSIKTES
jgi:exodeoxyribonuclease VII large subunit